MKRLALQAISCVICTFLLSCGSTSSTKQLAVNSGEQALGNEILTDNTDVGNQKPERKPGSAWVPFYRTTLETNVHQTELALETAEEAACSSELDPKRTYRVQDQLIILYRDGLTLAEINAWRQSIVEEQLSQITLSDDCVVETGTVRADQISTSFFDTPPSPSSIQPAENMLENEQYIAISRFLASQYQLEIIREVYYSHSNWCLVNVEPGVDEVSLASTIQRDNNDIVYCLDPNYIAFPQSFFPRAYDKRLDDIPATGTGIHPDECGRSKWDNGEGFAYFQAKTHRMHTSHLGI